MVVGVRLAAVVALVLARPIIAAKAPGQPRHEPLPAAAAAAARSLLSTGQAEEARAAEWIVEREEEAEAEGTTRCWTKSRVKKGKVYNRTLLWRESGLPDVQREYSVYVPPSYDPHKPAGLVLVFHGWGDPSSEVLMGRGSWPTPYHHFYGYRKAADASGFITVYPVGLHDCKGRDCLHEETKVGYESWNGVGTTASVEGGKTSCNQTVSHSDNCYYSAAAKKGKCHSCDWTTGYDDVGFVQKLVGELRSSFCVDPKRVFATGCSNGGMFVHELAQHLSGTFAAVAANCAGKPHRGFEEMPPGQPVSMMLVTGNHDQTIRGWETSVGNGWWDGFKYASRKEVFEAYRVRNQCPPTMQAKKYIKMQATVAPISRYEDKDVALLGVAKMDEADYKQHAMECYQLYYGCAGNSSLVSCEWDGGHDIMNGEPSAAYAFFAEHPRK